MSIERKFRRFFFALLRTLLSSSRAAVPNLEAIKKILVIRQHNQLGDMLCAVPLLRALSARFPQGSIVLMASPANSAVMISNRYLDDVIVYDKREFLGTMTIKIFKFIAFVKRLRDCRFDLVVVPSTVSTSLTSDLLAYLSGAPFRVGASHLEGVETPSGFFFNCPVALDWRTNPHRHQTLRNLDIVRPLGISTNDLSVEITLNSDEADKGKLFVQKRLTRKAFGIGLHPGSGKTPNRWSASRFALVANKLSEEFNAQVFVTFGPMDDGPVADMLSHLRVGHELVELMPIRIVAAIVAQLRLFVTNDTGIMHVAAAVGVPVLSVFGPTDPEQWAPIGGRNRYLYGVDGRTDTVTVEEVLQCAREMLRGKH